MATSLITTGVDIGGQLTTAAAWCAMDSSGSASAAIDMGSYNIDSIGDPGTGRIGVNFDVDMANTGYAIGAFALNDGGSNSTHVWGYSAPLVGTFELRHGWNFSNTLTDGTWQYIIVFGDTS